MSQESLATAPGAETSGDIRTPNDRPVHRRGVWRRVRRYLRLTLPWVPVVLLLVWTFLPFLMTISVSLKTQALVFIDRGLIPDNISFAAYLKVLESGTFRSAGLNTIIIAVMTLTLTLILTIPAAYAFAKFDFRGRRLVLVLSLLPLLIPKVGLMLPLFRMAANIGMLNSYLTLSVVLAGYILPLSTFLMVTFFSAIPKEVEEAAAVDGATLFQRLRFVIVPLAIPALVTVGILAFREAWTEFDLVLALTTNSDVRTLPYALFAIGEAEGFPDYPAQAAFAVLTIIPFMLVYSRFERYITQGFLSGSVK